MTEAKADLLQRTLDPLVSKVAALGPIHAFSQRIPQISRELLQVQQGSLYPALHRLEYKGWLQAEWRETETRHEAKFYSLAGTSKKRIDAEAQAWTRLTPSVPLILETSK